LKLNKTHGGKEFKSFFRFIGQVKKHVSGMGDNSKVCPIYEETITKTNKPRRVAQFDVLTDKFNNIHVQNAGMEKEFAYIYSSTDKNGKSIKWNDRADKSKYPSATYHLIAEPWDLTKEVGEKINDGDWVEVRGRYEFDSFTNEEGNTYPIKKCIFTKVEPVEDGKEVKFGGETFNYVCNFDDPNFREVNFFELEIGILSTYQDENTGDTKVNAVFLDYGKEASVPKTVELVVYQKETGKKSLADAFAGLDRGDFLKVHGQDNNRPIFSLVEDADNTDELFNDVEEQVADKSWAISGNKKGLEITGVVKNSRKPGLLTEDEIAGVVAEKVEDEEEPDWMRELKDEQEQ
jgi:hypothetical protein